MQLSTQSTLDGDSGDPDWDYKNESHMRELYVNRGWGYSKIADEIGSTSTTISRWCKDEHGIEKRDHLEATESGMDESFDEMRVELDEDELRRLYVDENMTQVEVADEMSVKKSVVGNNVQRHGIEKDRRIRIDESVLRELYQDQCLTQKEIGEKLGHGMSTVGREIRHYGIEPPFRGVEPKPEIRPCKENEIRCPNCNFIYKKSGLSKHWSGQQCSYPTYTDQQDDIIKGLMLGDGGLHRYNNHPIMYVSSTNRNFLEWVENEMGVLCTGNYNVVTEEDHLRYAEDHGTLQDDSEYKKTYIIQIRAHPHLDQYSDWYGEKNGRQVVKDVPEIDISPIMAKVWYCSDGHMSFDENDGGHSVLTSENFSTHNERLANSFIGGDFGFHTEYDGVPDACIKFNRSGTQKFLNWIGEPIDGFEYKWCSEDRQKYDRLKP